MGIDRRNFIQFTMGAVSVIILKVPDLNQDYAMVAAKKYPVFPRPPSLGFEVSPVANVKTIGYTPRSLNFS